MPVNNVDIHIVEMLMFLITILPASSDSLAVIELSYIGYSCLVVKMSTNVFVLLVVHCKRYRRDRLEVSVSKLVKRKH